MYPPAIMADSFLQFIMPPLGFAQIFCFGAFPGDVLFIFWYFDPVHSFLIIDDSI